MAPEKIYIAETPNKLIEIWSEEPIEPKPYITEHEYIRKDALLEWAKIVKQQSEELKGAGQGDVFYGAQIALIDEVIAKIESL